MAVRLNASGEYYRRTTNLPSTTAFTWMAWVYPITISGTNTFFSIDNGTSFIDCYLNGDFFRVFSSGVGQGTGSGVATATWYHLAITCSGTGANTLKVYLNGVEDISQAGASFSPSHIIFGDYNTSGGGPFDGRLAAVKMWDAALSGAEVAAEKDFYEPQRTTNKHAVYWMRNTAEAVTDTSGNGYTLTAVGTASDEDGPPGVTEPSSGLAIPVAMAQYRQRWN